MFVPPPHSRTDRVAELARLHALTDHRTAADTARAMDLNNTGGWAIWQDEATALRQRMPGWRGWSATARMTGAIATAFVGSQIAKVRYSAERPYELDPRITPLVHPVDSSYPSGHSAAAAAAAAVLSAEDPSYAAHYASRKQDVQWARMYSGVHLPSDIAAGDALGSGAARLFARD